MGRPKRPPSPPTPPPDGYVTILLERIAFQTYTGPLGFEAYLRMIRGESVDPYE